MIPNGYLSLPDLPREEYACNSQCPRRSTAGGDGGVWEEAIQIDDLDGGGPPSGIGQPSPCRPGCPGGGRNVRAVTGSVAIKWWGICPDSRMPAGAICSRGSGQTRRERAVQHQQGRTMLAPVQYLCEAGDMRLACVGVQFVPFCWVSFLPQQRHNWQHKINLLPLDSA